tara:strand:+ start:37924 stop:40362 length:2439 start_codon:yes stop_codon:yes gene_type:complete
MINISMKLNNFFEKIEKMDMGDVIKDFQKSDAPQFKGKSKKKRRQMAIAAKLNAEESVDESGCLGKQIKKGKAKKKESKINEYKYYTVKGPKGFKEKILAGSESDAKTKARHLAYRQGKASAGASRYSGTTDSDFEIQESYLREDVDLSDDMIGSPDSYYDEEERKEAFQDLKDAMDEFAKGWEQESVMQGICPNCAGTGYQDAEYPEYDDDGEEIEGSAYECDGHGMFGCDEGEMVGASWVDIIKHDEQNAQRKKAQDDYPGDEAVIDQIARAVKMMDDPRQMYQYMKADYPFMGIGQRSALIAKGMKKAGLTEGVLDHLDKGIYKDDEKREELQMLLAFALGDNFKNPDGWYRQKIEDLEKRLLDLDQELHNKKYIPRKKELFPELFPDDRPADYDVNMSPYESLKEEERYVVIGPDGRGKTHYSTEKEAEDTIKMIKDAGIKGEYKIQKQNFPQKSSVTEGEERSIIHDATVKHLIDEFTDRVDDMESLEELHDKMYMELEYLDVDEIVDPKMEVGGQPIGNYATGRVIDILDSGSVMDEVTMSLDLADLKDRDPVFPMQYEGKSPHKKGTKKYKKHMAAMHAEDVDTDSNEADVSKMLAKALGEPNKWTEMTAPELYAELESLDPDMADVIKLTAKMLYDVKLDENTKDKPSKGDCEPCKGTGYKDANVKDFKSCPVCDGDGEDPGFGGTKAYEEITLDEDQDFTEEFGILGYSIDEENTFEAEYRGRKVKLNKPMRGDVKKFKVYVKDPKTGNVKKVNFGHGGTSAKRPTMRIRKSNPKARKSFRARHNCDNPGPKTKARYWSCRKW